MSFKHFLAEMKNQEASKLLGLGSSFSQEELKKAYKKAAMKNHPDKGGSKEIMQQVNRAYEILQKISSAKSKIDNHNDIKAQYREAALNVVNQLKSSLNVNQYTGYFSHLFNEMFTEKLKKDYPTQDDVDKEAKRNFGISNAYLTYEWTSQDRKKVFELEISVSLSGVVNNNGLASSNTTFTMYVSTFAYIDGKKKKITSRDWSATNKTNVFDKPEEIFPKKKLISSKVTKFKKADMIAALKAELQATSSSDGKLWFIPIANGKFLGVDRYVFMRQPVWHAAIWVQQGKFTKKQETRLSGFFPESPETLDMFRKCKGKDEKNS